MNLMTIYKIISKLSKKIALFGLLIKHAKCTTHRVFASCLYISEELTKEAWWSSII